MATMVSYPGVYIEEVPSGARAIAGVATSIVAFVGAARRGPVDEPVFINSFGEFERIFGGLSVESPLSYAVRDFYLNGGAQAVIVRLFGAYGDDEVAARAAAGAVAKAARDAVAGAADAAAVAKAASDAAAPLAGAAKVAGDAVAKAANDAAAAPGASQAKVADAAEAKAKALGAGDEVTSQAKLKVGDVTLVAAAPGSWGNRLRARIDHDVAAADPQLYNLAVRDDATGAVELFRNLSIAPGAARAIDRVLANGSALVRLSGAAPTTRPAANPTPKPGEDPWSDANSAKVAKADEAGDGKPLAYADFVPTGAEDAKKGLFALDRTDLFNLLCLPPFAFADGGGDIDKALIADALKLCRRRRAMLILDPPSGWTTIQKAVDGVAADVGDASANAALYFPRLRQSDPLRDGQIGDFAPCGAIAGLFARTDATRGVWKAPAGLEAVLSGVPALSVPMSDLENGRLNQLGVNCLRAMPAAGRIAWGARTREGDDRLASPWKYVPVRRTALFIEESLYRGTQWVVFEPNDASLWAQIRLNIGAFMQRLFRQGAFQGAAARDAYFVKCDSETTTQADIDLGIVNILVGFAPLKPAEFVIIRLQQITADSIG